jgi:hypothetical protein
MSFGQGLGQVAIALVGDNNGRPGFGNQKIGGNRITWFISPLAFIGSFRFLSGSNG